MRFFFLLSCLIALPPGLVTAATIISHTGSVSPTSEGWKRSTTTTTVVGEAFNDDGREVWRIYDPGNSSGGTNLNYSYTLNADMVASVMESGWELSATISIPENDPDHSIAMAAGSNVWVGFIMNETPSNRRAWALIFGRDENGNTLVNTYGSGTARTLDPGYHDYSMIYNPITSLVTISIDGEFWKTYSGGSLANNGTEHIYWGDNSGQSAVQPGRAAYYDSVTFASVPEPSRVLFIGLGVATLLFHRRRGRLFSTL